MDPSTRRRWERRAAWLSFGAGAVHGVVAPEHFEEWWGYGLFFVFAAAAQVVLGLALLAHAFNERDSGPRWWSRRRAMLWTGVVGNLLVMALYAVTRTTGIPLLGPEAGVVEEVAPIDVLSKALEAATVVALLALLREREPAPAAPTAPSAPPTG